MSVVVAVDGGGSKTDVVVAAKLTGRVLARRRGPGCSQHAVGLAAAAQVVDGLVTAALVDAGVGAAEVAHAACYLTAIDLPDEQSAMRDTLGGYPWARRSLVVDNDVFALLRAGTSAPDAAVVVCGTGINGAAIVAGRPAARMLALGRSSGDWGGATGLMEEALWFAARAEDGRGEPTALRAAVPEWAGRPDVHTVVVDLHTGRLEDSVLWSHVPELLALAVAGDTVAVGLVRRQGEEIAVLAAALLARAGLADASVPVVLGGGIASCGDALLMSAVVRTLTQRAPYAMVSVADRPPVAGALDLALAAVGATEG